MFKNNETIKDRYSSFSTNANLIRFICALAVIISHSYNLSQNIMDPIASSTNGAISIGGLAVIVFFFYSGFYVTRSLLNNKKIGKFFKKRCLRLFPPLIIVVLFCVFLLGPFISSLNFTEYFSNGETYLYLLNGLLIPIHNLPGVFVNNIYGPTVNGALWTMPIEFLCYITLIVLFWINTKISKKLKNFKLIMIICTIICLILQIVLEFSNLYFYASLLRPILLFFIGSITFLYANKIIYSWKITLICLVTICISWFTPLFSLISTLFLPYPIIWLSLSGKQITNKIKITNYSYEMYLIGFPIQQLLVYIFHGQMLTIINAIFAIIIELIFIIIISWLRSIIKYNDKIFSK